MTRTSRDWSENAQTHIEETLGDIFEAWGRHNERATYPSQRLRKLAHEEDPDREDLRDATDELAAAFKGLADDAYDWAHEVHTFKSGSTLRQLRGKEPIGYSKRDGGASHGAYYGAQAQAAQFKRRVRWPLDLSEWEKETADRQSSTHPDTGEPIRTKPVDIDPVTAEGTTRYSRRIGGRMVYLVVDDRTRDPPI